MKVLKEFSDFSDFISEVAGSKKAGIIFVTALWNRSSFKWQPVLDKWEEEFGQNITFAEADGDATFLVQFGLSFAPAFICIVTDENGGAKVVKKLETPTPEAILEFIEPFRPQ